jgi:hypothetical protein
LFDTKRRAGSLRRGVFYWQTPFCSVLPAEQAGGFAAGAGAAGFGGVGAARLAA